MFFPVHDENPRRGTPIVTLVLIGVVLVAWFVVQGAGTGRALLVSICDLGMIPGELSGLAVGRGVPIGEGVACVVDPDPSWHTVITSMFLHGDWFHLLGNLWFLWLFGDNVEDDLGHVGFVAFYFVCGVAAAMLQFALDPASPVPMVGASGAISGVMGAYTVLHPRAPVRVVAVLIVFFTFIRVPAFVMLGYWFVLQLLGALPQLGGGGAGVAFGAHVGGFLAGVVIALVLRWRRREPEPEPYDS